MEYNTCLKIRLSLMFDPSHAPTPAHLLCDIVISPWFPIVTAPLATAHETRGHDIRRASLRNNQIQFVLIFNDSRLRAAVSPAAPPAARQITLYRFWLRARPKNCKINLTIWLRNYSAKINN
jgi:hypothetical protein